MWVIYNYFIMRLKCNIFKRRCFLIIALLNYHWINFYPQIGQYIWFINNYMNPCVYKKG